MNITPGSRIFARWTDGVWYEGQITALEGPAFGVLFDDGTKVTLQADDVVLAGSPPVGGYAIGTDVVGLWNDAYYAARVEARCGKLHLLYWDDGTQSWLSEDALQLPEEPLPKPDSLEGVPEIPVRSQPLPLDGRSYLERFKEMLAGLETNPLIKLTELNINSPASASLIEEIAQRFPVTDAMQRFYGEVNGLTVKWETDEEGVWGSIELLPIEEVARSWKDDIWWDADLVKPLHALEFLGDNAVVFHLDGSNNPPVCYWPGYNAKSLNIDFAGYLELLLKSRGYWTWPGAMYADMTGEEDTTTPGLFRQNMPRLFSDYDPSFFLRRKYEEKDAAAQEDRELKIMVIRTALDAQAAMYELDESGLSHIHITVADSAENLAKVASAVKELGLSDDMGTQWDSQMIGQYLFIKSASL